jgi:WD40 repeat protein
MTYAMQPTERGESSAMAAARGEEQNIPTLQQKTAESIARQIHDEKKSSFMFYGDEVQLNEFPPQFRDLIAQAYYRLYPEEFPPQFMQYLKNADDVEVKVHDLRFSSDGKELYGIYQDGLLKWALGQDGLFSYVDRQELLGHDAMSASMNRLAVNGGRTFAVFTRYNDNTVSEGQFIPDDPHALGWHSCHFSPDGTLLVGADMAEGLQIWSQDPTREGDVTQNPYRLIQRIPSGETRNLMSIGQSNNILATYDRPTHKITIWQREANNPEFKEIRSIKLEQRMHVVFGNPRLMPVKSIKSFVFSPDEKLLVITHGSGEVTILSGPDFLNEQILTVSDGNMERGTQVAFTPGDSSHFITNTLPLKVWDRDPRTDRFSLHAAFVNVPKETHKFYVRLSPDGEYMAIEFQVQVNKGEIWKLVEPTVEEIWNHILLGLE